MQSRSRLLKLFEKIKHVQTEKFENNTITEKIIEVISYIILEVLLDKSYIQAADINYRLRFYII
ncbi:1004_t:CDS:2 [Scutellospora calospora]|uniref:1004_t:CDS:1 n=1 Tax=Scutellospora calospora TaxID=85575 RepID=A0ACA9KC34_9GLOM|nr:1004_t:CDS:2 [Scutellospora calospora]